MYNQHKLRVILNISMLNKCEIVKWAHATGITMRLQAIILIGLVRACSSSAFSLNSELPCDFSDSINITDGILYSNNSIIFDDLEFPLGQYVKLDHTLVNGIAPVTVTPYTRGCICNRMPCIRLCKSIEYHNHIVTIVEYSVWDVSK